MDFKPTREYLFETNEVRIGGFWGDQWQEDKGDPMETCELSGRGCNCCGSVESAAESGSDGGEEPYCKTHIGCCLCTQCTDLEAASSPIIGAHADAAGSDTESYNGYRTPAGNQSGIANQKQQRDRNPSPQGRQKPAREDRRPQQLGRAKPDPTYSRDSQSHLRHLKQQSSEYKQTESPDPDDRAQLQKPVKNNRSSSRNLNQDTKKAKIQTQAQAKGNLGARTGTKGSRAELSGNARGRAKASTGRPKAAEGRSKRTGEKKESNWEKSHEKRRERCPPERSTSRNEQNPRTIPPGTKPKAEDTEDEL
ncbi:MAG: hypothetical protein MMC23_006160 [Stictis urceolatum]|nr:hypothetical protein [Stictis urceolata]